MNLKKDYLNAQNKLEKRAYHKTKISPYKIERYMKLIAKKLKYLKREDH